MRQSRNVEAVNSGTLFLHGRQPVHNNRDRVCRAFEPRMDDRVRRTSGCGLLAEDAIEGEFEAGDGTFALHRCGIGEGFGFAAGAIDGDLAFSGFDEPGELDAFIEVFDHLVAQGAGFVIGRAEFDDEAGGETRETPWPYYRPPVSR
jgi:hypothetical protein